MASGADNGTKSTNGTGTGSNNAAQTPTNLSESIEKILLKLPTPWRSAFTKFMGPEGGANKHLGEIKSVQVNSRKWGPVHKSARNPNDQEFVISAQIEGSKGTKVCHIYQDGSGTTRPNGDRV